MLFRSKDGIKSTHQDKNIKKSVNYNKSEKIVKKVLDNTIKGHIPENSSDDKKDYNTIKACLSKPQLISDLTYQLIKNKGEKYIEKIENPDDPEELEDFFNNLFTVMPKNNCNDAFKIMNSE